MRARQHFGRIAAAVVAIVLLTLAFLAFGVPLPYATTYGVGLTLIGVAAWNDAERADAAEAELARRIAACEEEARARELSGVGTYREQPRKIP